MVVVFFFRCHVTSVCCETGVGRSRDGLTGGMGWGWVDAARSPSSCYLVMGRLESISITALLFFFSHVI